MFGLSATIVSAVAYFLPFGIIFLLIEDDNEFVSVQHSRVFLHSRTVPVR